MADETEGQIGPVLDRTYFQWTANNEYAISHHYIRSSELKPYFIYTVPAQANYVDI